MWSYILIVSVQDSLILTYPDLHEALLTITNYNYYPSLPLIIHPIYHHYPPPLSTTNTTIHHHHELLSLTENCNDRPENCNHRLSLCVLINYYSHLFCSVNTRRQIMRQEMTCPILARCCLSRGYWWSHGELDPLVHVRSPHAIWENGAWGRSGNDTHRTDNLSDVVL